MKFQLLNIDANAKTVKGRKRGYMTAILYLTPANASGVQLCAMSEIAQCVHLCLNTAGRGGMSKGNATFTTDAGTELPDNAVQRARLRRTEWYLRDRAGFMARLALEILAALRMAERADLDLVVRLNGTSDIRWENEPVGDFANIFALFPHVQFYDYTKLANRRISRQFSNYHLTFSFSAADGFAKYTVAALKNYGSNINFAVVFSGPMPENFLGRRVVNGDESDLRFLDPHNVVVGLTAKGRAKRDTSGMVVYTKTALAA
jgi:hypothetical protein